MNEGSKYFSFCFTPSEDFLDGLDRTDMVKEVFPGCRWISCMVINYVCNLCKGGSRKLGEHHSSACNEDWLSAPCLTSALNADKQTAPSLSSTISLPCLATLIPATCHLWHTMLNALVSTAHSISSFFTAGSVKFYRPLKYLAALFTKADAVGNEGLGFDRKTLKRKNPS